MGNGKGISKSCLPYRRTPPSWLNITSQQVADHVCKLARKGYTPSQIGNLLRDSHGLGQAKIGTGSKILRILKVNGLAPSIPEDLYYLIKKAVSVRKHLAKHNKDLDSNRIPHSQTLPLLPQNQATPTNLEVRICYCFC